MNLPPNLITDSKLLQETFDFVRERGGRAGFKEIADAVFRLSNANGELSASLVGDLVRNDRRFSFTESHLILNDRDLELYPLNELEFVVLDVEAIGARSVPTRIIELGAYRVSAGQIRDEFQTLINPETVVPQFIASLTGISNDALSRAPKFADVVRNWLNFAGDSVLVAHNADFDVPLLNQEIARVFPGYRMSNAQLCTVRLSRCLTPSLDGHSLDAMADHFGFEIAQRHRAASDAHATARILLRLLDELEINGVRTLAEARTFRLEKQTKQADLELTLDA